MIDLVPEATNEVHVCRARVEGRERDALEAQDAADDLTEAPEPGDEHAASIVGDLVEGALVLRREAARNPISRDVQERGDREYLGPAPVAQRQDEVVGMHLAPGWP
jgi:hypothetical protein